MLVFGRCFFFPALVLLAGDVFGAGVFVAGGMIAGDSIADVFIVGAPFAGAFSLLVCVWRWRSYHW